MRNAPWVRESSIPHVAGPSIAVARRVRRKRSRWQRFISAQWKKHPKKYKRMGFKRASASIRKQWKRAKRRLCLKGSR